MCLYWRKIHTCSHVGDRPYIELCRPGVASNTVCADISNDEAPRKSHFPCYSCIKSEARAELEAKARANEDALAKTAEAQQRAYKEKHAAEQRAKEERIRREAREKAAREREEEMRTKKAKAEEERKAKREGGLWIETHSGKKSKGRKSGGAGPTNPLLSLPVPKTTAGAASRENKAMPGSGVVDRSPKKEKSVDLGGRAGTWGPKRILSRKENGGGVQGGSGALNGGGAANGGLKK